MAQKQGIIEGTAERLNRLMKSTELNLELKILKGKLMFRIRDKVDGGRIVFLRRKRRRVNHTKDTTPDYSEADWMAYGFDFPARQYKTYSVDASKVTPGQWTEFPFDWKTLVRKGTHKGQKGCRFLGNVYPKFCSGSSNTRGERHESVGVRPEIRTHEPELRERHKGERKDSGTLHQRRQADALQSAPHARYSPSG